MNKRNRMMGRLGGKRSVLALVAVLLVLCVAVGGTVAYLTSSTDPVTNTFTPGTVGNEITEEFENGVKKNVAVKNTGNVDAYIRAKIVVNWADKDGVVLAQPVPAEAYTMTLNTGTGATQWKDFATEDGTTYYYNSVVPPYAAPNTGVTANLINSCQLASGFTPPDGYNLQVTILSESIQADGMASENKTAVADAWGYEFNNGTWTAVSADIAEP